MYRESVVQSIVTMENHRTRDKPGICDDAMHSGKGFPERRQNYRNQSASAVGHNLEATPGVLGVLLGTTVFHGLVLGTLLALGSTSAGAQPVALPALSNPVQAVDRGFVSKQGLGIQFGFNSDYKKGILAYEPVNMWDHQFAPGWGMLGLTVEFGASYWKSRRRDRNSMWQLSAIPILRWWPQEKFYLEAGVGPTLLSRSQFAGRDLSTRFQFGSYFGAGVLIQNAHRVGLRYSHYSNANIKRPNPGLDVFQLTYTYMF